MSLFNAIDGVVKIRKIPYADVEKLPFYEFKYILDNIEKEQEEAEKDKDSQSNTLKQSKQQQLQQSKQLQYKPIDSSKLFRDSQRDMQKSMPKI